MSKQRKRGLGTGYMETIKKSQFGAAAVEEEAPPAVGEGRGVAPEAPRATATQPSAEPELATVEVSPVPKPNPSPPATTQPRPATEPEASAPTRTAARPTKQRRKPAVAPEAKEASLQRMLSMPPMTDAMGEHLRSKRTVLMRQDHLDELRGLAFYVPGASLNKLVENALSRELERLRTLHNQGKIFPSPPK